MRRRPHSSQKQPPPRSAVCVYRGGPQAEFMTRRLAAPALALIAVFSAVPLASAESTVVDRVSISKTERIRFSPQGTIRLNGSFGDLNIEGWDRPEVEITVVKATKRNYKGRERDAAVKRLDRIRVVTGHPSTAELTISTILPSRTLARLRRGRTDVNLEYQIRAPHSAHFIIHHGTGEVVLIDLSGEVEATAHVGDIVLMLPQKESYAIDAKSNFGTVWSDFAGDTHSRHLVGRQFLEKAQSSAHRIYLRIGVGGITIKETTTPPEGAAVRGL